MGQHQVSSITHSDEVQDMNASSSLPINRRTLGRTVAAASSPSSSSSTNNSPRGGGALEGGIKQQQQQWNHGDTSHMISTFRSSMPVAQGADANSIIPNTVQNSLGNPSHPPHQNGKTCSLPIHPVASLPSSSSSTITTRSSPTRRTQKSKGKLGAGLLATSFSRRHFNDDLIGDDESQESEEEDDENYNTEHCTTNHVDTNHHHYDDNVEHDSDHDEESIRRKLRSTLYPKTHYSYYWKPNVYKDCFMPTTSSRSSASSSRYLKQTNTDLYASLSTDDTSQCLEWTIRLDPENDPQFYELAFSLFHFQKPDDEYDEAVIPTSHSIEEEQNVSSLAFNTHSVAFNTTTTATTSPQNIHTNHTSPKKNHRENGVTSPQSLTHLTATTPNSDAPTSVPSSLIMGSSTTTTTASSTTMDTDPFSIGLGTSSSTYLNIPSPSYHRPRGRAFLIGSQSSSSSNPHASINSSSSNHFYPFESDRNSRDISSSSPLLNSAGINHLHCLNQSDGRFSSNSNMYLNEKRRKSLERTSRDYRRELYLEVLRTRFENRGAIPQDEKDHNKRHHQKSTHYISASQIEQKVPFEIMFQILSYLTPEDLIKLGNVSRTFRYIWTEHPLLWVRYPYVINNENGDLNLGEMVEQEKSRIGSSFIDHASLRELIEESPFTTEKTNIVRSSWKNIYRAIYHGYTKGPWNNYCTFYNNVNTQSVEYRLSMIEIKVCLVGGSGTGKSSWILMLKDANNGETPEIYKSRSKKIEYMETTIGASYTVKHIKVTLPHAASSSNDSQDDDSISSETDSYIMNRFVPIISESIWDTSGVKRYFPLIPLYLRTCKGIILCFDLNRQESFDEMIEIFEEYIFKQQANKCETMDLFENKHLFEKCLQEQDTYVYVCGMKSDKERHVSNEKITQFLHKYGGSRIKIFTNNFLYFELSSLTGENVYTPWLHLAYCVALNNQNDHA
ncbi:hypothetical protein FDP41_012690 [Naegleria fowleri]|uniref:F-box domain-containing protein n=1 Tax=Naegleria fowleri TaxID=5763 RepID=A0A6A5C2B7_NAEFO|nr:uncharacterized protein FDP41_012690 [Naegleria fowleri]KAF0980902.1 hypothetical protein FDP41_012690 [Naegleria fowleri]